MSLKDQKQYFDQHAVGLKDKLDKIKELNHLDYDEGILEVIRFLNLIHESKQRLTPSHLVDLIWHEMILFTKCYMSFCDYFYHCYVHHHPGGELEENKRQYHKTLQLYDLKYGPPKPEFWPGGESIASHCGSCSS